MVINESAFINKTGKYGTPLMIQWLGLYIFTAETPRSIPGWGTRSRKLRGVAKQK